MPTPIMPRRKITHELSAKEANLLGYIIERAICTLEYDKESGDYKSNDDFVVALDKPDYLRLKRLAKKL